MEEQDRALTKTFILISLVILIIAGGWVASSYFIGKRNLETLIDERGRQLMVGYEADLATYSRFMLDIAEFVARDVTVNRLFGEGAAALEAGDTAAAENARQRLLEHVNASWSTASSPIGQRIMHFHVPPATSFLRVHEPGRFGDDLSGYRASVVEANTALKPIIGYESGRYFRGIRAVVPVDSQEDPGRHIGVLEVGIAMDRILSLLAEQSAADVAIMLSQSHIEGRIADEKKDSYLAFHGLFDGMHLDWATDTEGAEAVLSEISPGLQQQANTFLWKTWQSSYGITRIPLVESASKDDKPIGTILAWFDASKDVQALHGRTVDTLLIALVIVLVLEGMVYYALMRERDLLIERNASLTDALTGIANRRHFDETFEQEICRASRGQSTLSVILCDIDHFKKYNDYYGHQAGDQCIQQVAKALQGALRRAGDFVARYGGEEFVAILPDTDATDAGVVAQRLRVAVESIAVVHGKHPTSEVVTISLGVSSGHLTSVDSAETLLATADRALYAAKDAGRNCVRFEEFSAPSLTGSSAAIMYR